MLHRNAYHKMLLLPLGLPRSEWAVLTGPPSDALIGVPQQNVMPLGWLGRTDSFVKFVELKLTTVDRCISLNCAYHYAIILIYFLALKLCCAWAVSGSLVIIVKFAKNFLQTTLVVQVQQSVRCMRVHILAVSFERKTFRLFFGTLIFLFLSKWSSEANVIGPGPNLRGGAN